VLLLLLVVVVLLCYCVGGQNEWGAGPDYGLNPSGRNYTRSPPLRLSLSLSLSV